jgi:hypothetical protein
MNSEGVQNPRTDDLDEGAETFTITSIPVPTNPTENTAQMIPTSEPDPNSTFQLTLKTPSSTIPEHTQIDRALTNKLGQIALASNKDKKSWWAHKTSQNQNGGGEGEGEGSFFTARGTLRSLIAGEEVERSVIVGWMGRVGTLRFAEVSGVGLGYGYGYGLLIE